ncbi:MAG: ribosome biogenesis GTPase YlqF [Synechococcales cyanobacterium RM1_1_8]|nr:ribosome biogenesis GTPase YlqF [Synechococcales cyanobacterium RM1_1_8]
MPQPTIQWYPGHIAKAERALKEQLKRVDVILEVRDARIPLSTHHPQISLWAPDKPCILVLNRQDMIPAALRDAWRDWFHLQGNPAYFTDAQRGTGVKALAKVAAKAGEAVNDRRLKRGMKPRAVRTVVIGYPNVGKSALINRLVGRRVVDSARKAGVTRQLRWVRIDDNLDLLDAPGILPARLNDQTAAIKLALCDDIGTASYDNQRVAAALVDQLKTLQRLTDGQIVPHHLLRDRYSVDEWSGSGEDYLLALGAEKYQGDIERATRQILRDFRKGTLGPIPLEVPPTSGLPGPPEGLLPEGLLPEGLLPE